MTRPPVTDLDRRLLRTSGAFALVEHRRLPAAERRVFRRLADAPDHFGLLIPKEGPGLGILAVDHALAGLLRAARRPRTAAALRGERSCPTDGELARLVLDGVLEIETGDGYRSGPASLLDLLDTPPPEPDASSRTSGLSLTALRWAQESAIEEPAALSTWLYRYNHIPASPAWARRLRGRDRVLGLGADGALAEGLERRFRRDELPGWTSWHALDGAAAPDDDRPTYKLYVSPRPEALAEALRALVPRLAGSGAYAFKLGSDLGGLLRPDKLIVYCTGEEALRGLAASLAEALSGCPAHGVPFTAALTPDGLLSWGMDPPRSSCIPGWRGIESWRLWVTDRLARALLRARALGSGGLAPWRYALARLALEGVDGADWLPSGVDWGEREAAA